MSRENAESSFGPPDRSSSCTATAALKGVFLVSKEIKPSSESSDAQKAPIYFEDITERNCTKIMKRLKIKNQLKTQSIHYLLLNIILRCALVIVNSFKQWYKNLSISKKEYLWNHLDNVIIGNIHMILIVDNLKPSNLHFSIIPKLILTEQEMNDYYNNIDQFIELINKYAIKGEDLMSVTKDKMILSTATPLDPSFLFDKSYFFPFILTFFIIFVSFCFFFVSSITDMGEKQQENIGLIDLFIIINELLRI
jgi:hypothetical protein